MERIERIKPAMTVPQAAKYIGVSKGTMYKLVETGQLTHIRFGRSIRIRPEHLREYEEKCLVIASDSPQSTEGFQTTGMSSGLKKATHGASLQVIQTNKTLNSG